MNITYYEGCIDRILNAHLPAQVPVDELGNTLPANQYRAEQLSALSQEIRRIAWMPSAHERFMRVAAEADEWAARLLGNPRPQPAPRFDALVSNGIIHPAIQ